MNTVVLIGNMTRDPETRTVNDKIVCNFTLAVNRPWKTDEVDFIRCQCWGKIGENTETYCEKGSKVGISGRLQIRKYEKDGQNREIAEVVCDRVEFLGSKKKDVIQGEEVDALDVPF